MRVSRNIYHVTRVIFCFVFLLTACSLQLAACFADDITFEAAVSKNKVFLGQSIQLSFTFQNTRDIPSLELPEIEGFSARYSGPSTMMSVVNGKVASSITHNYILIPLKEGTFTIGPFSVNYKGKNYASKPITVEVVPEISSGSSQVSGGTETELGDRIFAVMEVEKSKVYLNEPLPVTIKLYVNSLAVRNIQYPRFEHEGFSADKPQESRWQKEILGGIGYDVKEFKADIFGMRPGEFVLGPAYINCDLMVKKQRSSRSSSLFGDLFGDDFFVSYENYPLELESASIPITVLALPESGRPSGFSGAVGDFEFDAEAQPGEVKVGDPITLKMVISGKGNFATVTAPKIDTADDFKVYDSQVTITDSSKVFEYILIPKTEKITQVPEAVFSFFDTEKEEYKTITRGPFAVNILALPKEEKLAIVEYSKQPSGFLKKEELGKGLVYIKETAGKLRKRTDYLYKNKLFLLLQILPLIFLTLFLTLHKRFEKIRTDTRYARKLAAPKKAKAGLKTAKKFLSQGKTAEFYDSIFKTIQEYLGDKFHLPTAGITVEVVDEVLKSKGVSAEALAKLEEIFKDCDMARYAPSEFSSSKMEESFKKLEEAIDYLQRKKI